MSNSAYLKKYVENHPKNKMGWYLLGKEYEASGQEGKAHYCYIQAGSVYEAFEASKVPADLWREYQENLLQESIRKERQGRNFRKIGLAVILLFLIWLPSAHAPGSMTVTVQDPTAELRPSDQRDLQETSSAVSSGDKPSGEPGAQPSAAYKTYTAMAYDGDSADKQKALAGFLVRAQGQGGYAGETTLLGMRQSGKWLLWSDRMPVVYSMTRDPKAGTATLQSYDTKACNCTPPDATKLQQGAGSWIKRQESLAVLSSAIQQFKEHEGKWPASLQALTGEFPGNWLAGADPIIEEAFAPVLERVRQQQDGGGIGQAGGNTVDSLGKTGGLSGDEPYFTKPLEVIVDTDNHRLAVVSGQVILRSYKVGLGGANTPEGAFRITDKVVNPNGRDDGEFGSRGMQLSATNYAIHGTNEPDSIGKDESLGCIRMMKEDVEELFDLLPKGSKVTIGKGVLPTLDSAPKKRFAMEQRQNQTNPGRTYHWLY